VKERVYQVAPQAPENGIKHGGYNLVYSDTPPEWEKRAERPESLVDLRTSIGFRAQPDGTMIDVGWNSPAFKAGLVPGMQITAVNGTAFKRELLRTAITDAEKSPEPIKFLVKRDDQFETISVDYHGGLRYPKLERIAASPDFLDEILAAK
jgi:predicted metalloprotease with PDZ domain